MHLYPAQKKGFTYSGVMHVVLIILLIAGVPTLLFSEPDMEEPTAIVVDILPIGAMSNVKPSTQKPAKPAEKPEEKKKEKKEIQEKPLEPVKEEKAKASPVVKTEETPPPPPPEPIESPDVPKEKIPEKPKDTPKKEVKVEDPLDAILKGVKNTAAAEKKESKPAEADEEATSGANRSNQFDPSSPEAVSIRDAIQSQIFRCWNVPAGARNAENLIVPLEIDYDAQGNPQKVQLASGSQVRYGADPFFRAAADSAMRAVKRCAPLENMPVESYNIWQYVDMNFNPRDMLY